MRKVTIGLGVAPRYGFVLPAGAQGCSLFAVADRRTSGGNGAVRVLLVSNTILPHRRRFIAGLIDYARERTGWELEHVADAGELAWHWAVSGLAGAIVEGTQMTPALRRRLAGVPRVVAGHEPADDPDCTDPRVQVDDAAIAAVAAEHLLQAAPGTPTRLRALGHVGPAGAAFCREREAELARLTIGAGAEFDRLDTQQTNPAAVSGHRELEAWLRDLPKPCGIVTAGSMPGREIIGCARHAGLAVPEDVAVVAVGEDEQLCNLCVPALSAVDPNGGQVGWLAAGTLDRLMRGEPVPPLTRAPPGDLIARRSSDVLRIDHAGVRRAVELIRDEATGGLTAADVLGATTVPRRTLEVAFKRHLGRTIYGEITRVRVEHAKRLLRSDDGRADSITEVALDSGFGGGGPFAEVFRRVTGESPRQYRARHRRR